jgi:hypothetical protein
VTVFPGQRVGRRGLEPLTPCASCVFDSFRAVHPGPSQTADQDFLFTSVHCRSYPFAGVAYIVAYTPISSQATDWAYMQAFSVQFLPITVWPIPSSFSTLCN